MLQRSVTKSRCRVHIWHGCTMLFVKILAFDQNVGNANRCTTVSTRRRLLSMWLCARHASVRFGTVWILSPPSWSQLLMDLGVECTWRGKFHSLQCFAPRMRSMHLGHKTETRWARTSPPTARSGYSSPRTAAFLAIVHHLQQRSWSLHRQPWWGGIPSVESR